METIPERLSGAPSATDITRNWEMSASGVCIEGGGVRIWPTINVNKVVIFLFLRKGLIYPINMHFKCAYFVLKDRNLVSSRPTVLSLDSHIAQFLNCYVVNSQWVSVTFFSQLKSIAKC